MTTYHIDLEGDILRVKFGKPANGDQIVRDAAIRLDELCESGILKGGKKLLKIDGPASLPVCYQIAHKVSHLYSAVAIYDPKIGNEGYKTYIVTITHTPTYQIGELIETEEPQQNRPIIKLVLCGPPQSGKSCLREGLKQAISSIKNAPYPYMITACPDGEGAWFSEAARRDPKLARQLKDAYKAKFTPEFATTAAKWVSSANTPLNIIDVGGKITDENRKIMRDATHAVILSKDLSLVKEWKDVCKELSLDIVAIIHSNYEGKEDKVNEDSILMGSVHYLERGEDVSSRMMVQALANRLVELVKSGKK
jgi:CRISPR-associated protein Csx3